MPSVAAITVAVVHAMPFVREACGCTARAAPVSRVVERRRGRARRARSRSRSSPRVREQVVAVAGREVHELVGELVVVLQRVHERGGVDPDARSARFEREPQELGVAGDQRVVVGRAG